MEDKLLKIIKLADELNEKRDEELFESVQRKLNIRKKTKKKKFEWMLNGLVYCKECHSQMVLKVKYYASGEIKSKKIYCTEGVKKNSKLFCKKKK